MSIEAMHFICLAVLLVGKVERPDHLSEEDGEGVDVLISKLGQRLVPNSPPSGAAVPFTVEHVDTFVLASEAIAAGKPMVAVELLQKL